jgi:hypothetical protein
VPSRLEPPHHVRLRERRVAFGDRETRHGKERRPLVRAMKLARFVTIAWGNASPITVSSSGYAGKTPGSEAVPSADPLSHIPG